LSALLTPTPDVPSASSGILAVGQENTQGFSHLAFTTPELAAIKRHAHLIRYLQLDGEDATVSTVLNAMEEYSWVHLACHASQDVEDPTQSAFHLHDGDLMLAEITKKSFNNKGLAFLSACQTATGHEELPDEAVHLAAGMLMAGYPSVIATMWAIYDEDGPEVAQHVYAELLKDGKLDCTRAARALHKAMGSLREKVGDTSFKRWIPFVHIGL
jgi:CHAT domain-containing protein